MSFNFGIEETFSDVLEDVNSVCKVFKFPLESVLSIERIINLDLFWLSEKFSGNFLF